MRIIYILITVLLFFSCIHKTSSEEKNILKDQLKEDSFLYKGSYQWAFDLMGTEQISTHILYPDSIKYKMTGRVYSTNYVMKKISYESLNGKWIGEDDDGIVYVLFFKEKTDSTLTIYKRKCKTGGLKEALNFNLPTANTTDDHGWNVYSLNGNDSRDVLPFSGNFITTDNNISISDSILTFNKKKST
ncbi:hypothetical protein [Tenacibaculum xiamenense]|uniref:hypothetical protein n=1 Tax=Tenacibaculum xiamenense TaxID=1261553 RepID=UPI003893945B